MEDRNNKTKFRSEEQSDNREIEDLVKKLKHKLQNKYPEDSTAQMDSKMEFHLGAVYKEYQMQNQISGNEKQKRKSDNYYGTEKEAIDNLGRKPRYNKDLFSRIKSKQFYHESKKILISINVLLQTFCRKHYEKMINLLIQRMIFFSLNDSKLVTKKKTRTSRIKILELIPRIIGN